MCGVCVFVWKRDFPLRLGTECECRAGVRPEKDGCDWGSFPPVALLRWAGGNFHCLKGQCALPSSALKHLDTLAALAHCRWTFQSRHPPSTPRREPRPQQSHLNQPNDSCRQPPKVHRYNRGILPLSYHCRFGFNSVLADFSELFLPLLPAGKCSSARGAMPLSTASHWLTPNFRDLRYVTGGRKRIR